MQFEDKKVDRWMMLETTVSQAIAGRYEIEHAGGHFFVEPGEMYLHQANTQVTITHHFGTCGRMEAQWVRFHSRVYKAHDAMSLFTMPLKIGGARAMAIGKIIGELAEVVNHGGAQSQDEIVRCLLDTYRIPMLLMQLVLEIAAVSVPREGSFALLDSADRMAPVLEHIHKHLSETIHVEDLAEVACMSQSYFHAAFKQAFQQSPIHYIRGLRIREACQLLSNTQQKIQDIAELTGFGNAYYFCRAFKMVQGCSPKEYRRVNRSIPS
jgi:AraC-like DNA-binding protein